jgi:hypothetical protein
LLQSFYLLFIILELNSFNKKLNYISEQKAEILHGEDDLDYREENIFSHLFKNRKILYDSITLEMGYFLLDETNWEISLSSFKENFQKIQKNKMKKEMRLIIKNRNLYGCCRKI